MAFPTLVIVSPNTKNSYVNEAQHLLTNNRFGVKYYKGTIDGQYGPLAGAAAWRAKFWAGYPLGQCDHAFGAKLRSYLLPVDHPQGKKLPVAYAIRRAARIKAAKNKPAETNGQKAIKLAETWLGYKEFPANTNQTTFGKWYGADGNPWCAYFASYILTHIGVPFHCGYVPTIVAWARSGQNNCFTTNDPQEGDPVCFDWNNDGEFDHIGLFKKWIDRAAGTFETVEGNTSPDEHGDQSNGGEVCDKTRSTKAGYGVVFVRVKGL